MTNISVVIPTFNRKNRVIQAIESVCNQTHPPSQVVVVDDGSTDDTAQMIQNSYPEITLLEQCNRGVSAARNAGIAVAKGDWIAFLDSDDRWLPEKLARQVAELKRCEGVQLCHCDEIWIRNGRRVNPRNVHKKRGGHIFEHCLPRCCISPSATLMRRGLFSELGEFDETLPACEDYDYWLRLCTHYPVHYIDEPLLVKYGGHSDQLSKMHWGMDRFRIRVLMRLLKSGTLSSEQESSTLAVLRKKVSVYGNGARRRGRMEEVNKLQKELDEVVAFYIRKRT